MQYRLITLFKWMTVIAVVLGFSMFAYSTVSIIQGPPLLAWGRFFAVWGPIIGGAYLFIWWGIRGKPNDHWITYGLLVGVALGVVAGNLTTLGEWAIDHFNPTLPYQDFRAMFGSIVGCIVGAWFGALGGGIASSICRRKIA